MKVLPLILAVAVGVTAMPAFAKLNVVTTTADLAAIAREIGADKVDVSSLARPTEDPHFVDAKPGFITKLNRADVLIEGGAGLEEGWLGPLIASARNPKLREGAPGRVVGNTGVKMLGVPATLDRSRGDIHAAGNPHYLVDPANAKIVAATIADALGKVDSAGSDTYRANLKRFQDTIDARVPEWQKKMTRHKGAHLVAYHDSWPYFAERFGLKIELFLEPKPGIPPTPSHIASLVEKMRERNVRAILVDVHLNRRHAESLASKTRSIVVPVTHFPGGVKGTDRYVELMDYLVNSVSQALSRPG